VALDIGGKTIHQNFKQSICEAINGPHLLEAMQLRYDWLDRTLELINWEAHRQALQTQTNQRTHMVKLCHDILPTGSNVGMYRQGLPDYCALCQTPSEDFCHILQCEHHTRSKWRETLLSDLSQKCYTISMDQSLLDILLTGVSLWLNGTPPDFSNIDSRYQQLIEEQTQIGWKQVF
jgi:hypothetical protein